MVLTYNRQTGELGFASPITLESPLSILIVDDDLISQFILQHYLLHDEPLLRVDIASSGEAALQIFQDRLHRLIFLTPCLPETNSLELLVKFQEIAGNSPLSIIAHSDKADDKRELLQQGFSAFLPKPCIQDELRMVLQQVSSPIDTPPLMPASRLPQTTTVF